MAETLLNPVIEKLVDLLIQEAKSLKGVRRELESVKRELEIIEPLLRDAEAKSAKGQVSDAAKVWLKQLRVEAERIEDVIDEYTYHLDEQRIRSGVMGSLKKAGHYLKSLKPRHTIASEIRNIEDSLRKIKDSGLSYGLRPFQQGGSSSTSAEGNAQVDPRIGSLFVDDDELVGIESMSKELVKSLVEGSPTCMVVSLVGEGGIGKTTLARKVYKDVVEKGCFDNHVWITVSQSYNIDKILKILINQICPHGGELIATEEAFELLRNSLLAKRYVIVFDDVWQTDFCNVVKHALPSNAKGNRVIVTTRNATVVESFRKISHDMIIHELKAWSENQAWELFCKNAFSCSGFNSCCPPELEQLSREILNKCEGLPLAVVAVAGLLSRKQEKSKVEWKRVLDNLNIGFEENHDLLSVTNVLLLSYHDLPNHLRPCFLYFGMFPEDYLIAGEALCRFWIAEGFIQSRKDKLLEQIAEEYLIELIDRNLVAVELQFSSHRLFKVHDLIYEMILGRNKELSFCQLIKKDSSSLNEKSRRLSICDTTGNVLKVIGDFKIRSISLYNIDELCNSFVVGIFKICILLKVLNFEDVPLFSLPKEVGNLLHLKYLSLRGTKVKMLPKSIGNLRNLQTLDVRETLVRELPIEINKLRNLRHLVAYAFNGEIEHSLSSFVGVRMHEGLCSLEELQTLLCIEANPGKLGFMKELQNMRKLKSFGISKVTANMGKALREFIEKMNHLEELIIASTNEEHVLDLSCVSSPPRLLCTLVLNCRLRQLPSWISGLHNLRGLDLSFSRLGNEPLNYLKDLPQLAKLRLFQAYEGEELQFEEGGFEKLKELRLRKLEGLKAVKIDKGALPRLEKLIIGPSPLMKEMPSGFQHLTNLKSIEIFDMPKEFVEALQLDGGSEYWKIQHIPNVTFWYYSGRGLDYCRHKLGNSELLQLRGFDYHRYHL